MNINGFERLIQRVSPGWALRRYAARVKVESVQRAYEAIEPSRLRKKREDQRSPDQIGALSVDKLRFQARFLDENLDVARSVLNTLVNNIVGQGILTFPMMMLTDGSMAEAANSQTQKLWEEWGKRPDTTWEYSWGKIQQLAARSWFRDGEMFTQKLRGTVEGLEHGGPVELSLELMEADFCPTNLFDDGTTPRVSTDVAPGNRVRQGVEKNIWGRPEAYWFWKDYPTEISSQFSAVLIAPINQSIALNSTTLNRIEATNIIHLKLTDRIRQTRGISLFSSVYKRLDDLKEYEESERTAARIGAAFAFAIHKSLDTPGGTTDNQARWREMDLAPGIIADSLAPGETVESLKNERPSNLLTEFRTSQLRSVSGGTNASFSSLSKQYEGSYSSQRQELMESFQIYRAIRMEFVNRFVADVYEEFVTMAIMQGLIDVTGVDSISLFKAAHLGSGVPYIDPRREVEADEIRVAAGFSSRHQVVLERGGNPEDTFRLIEEETERDEEAGLAFTTSANSGGGETPSGEAPSGDEVEEPDEDLEDEEVDEEGMLEGTDIGSRFGFPTGEYQLNRRYEGPDGNVYIYTLNGFVREAKEASG